jgi:uncharacterized damage-inducible protein DinB
MMRPFAEHFRFTNFIMNLVIGDVTNDDAIHRTRDSEGPSISWIVGHLGHHRFEIMKLLGTELDDELAEKFAGGSSDGSDYPDIAELRNDWERIHAELESVIESVTDGQLARRTGGDGSRHGEKTVLDALSFYAWHEIYHMGQLGTIRTQLGYPATADLAVAAARSAS